MMKNALTELYEYYLVMNRVAFIANALIHFRHKNNKQIILVSKVLLKLKNKSPFLANLPFFRLN